MPEPEDGCREAEESCSAQLQDEAGSLRAATEVQRSALVTPRDQCAAGGVLVGKNESVQEEAKKEDESENCDCVGAQTSEPPSVGTLSPDKECVSEVTEGSCKHVSESPVPSSHNGSVKIGQNSACADSRSFQPANATVSTKRASSEAATSAATHWKGSTDGPRWV